MYKNTLCTRDDCAEAGDCRHRGPRGEYCFYDVEKKLAYLLGEKWTPDLQLDELLRKIEARFAEENKLTARLATRMTEPRILTPELEHETVQPKD